MKKKKTKCYFLIKIENEDYIKMERITCLKDWFYEVDQILPWLIAGFEKIPDIKYLHGNLLH